MSEVNTIEGLIGLVDELFQTPKRPPVKGSEVNNVFKKVIEFISANMQSISSVKSALIIPPVYQVPTVNITSSQATSSLEVGQTISIPLSLQYVQKDGGAPIGAEIQKNGVPISNQNAFTDENVQISTIPIVYSGRIHYGDGPVKNTNFNDPYPTGKITASTAVSGQLSYVGYYKIFFASVPSAPLNSEGVRALAGQQLTNAANTFTINTGTTYKTFSFWLPNNKSLKSVIDQDSLGADVSTEYVGTAMAVNDAGGNAVNGTLYTMSPAVPYSTNHRHLITIQ